MATITGSTSNKYIDAYIEWSYTQNQSANQSTVTATLKYSRNNSGYTTSGNWKGSITINGVTTSAEKHLTITQNSGTVAVSATVVVNHNSDGSKAITISASGGMTSSSSSLQSTSVSSTVSLTTIPRASSVSAVASSYAIGGTSQLRWTPASTGFYYKVNLSISDWSWTSGAIHPNQTSQYTYTTPPLSTNIVSKLPNSTSGTMTAKLYTYSNSACTTQVGSTTQTTFTVTVPSSYVPSTPTVTISPASSNSTVTGWGEYVAGYTSVKVQATSSGTNGSTISSFTISGGTYSTTQNGTSLSYQGSVVTSSGEKTFTVVATDSRGRASSSASQKATFYGYSKPQISNASVARDASDPTKVNVKATFSYSPVNGKNSATATVKYKKSTASSYSNPVTLTNNTTTEIPGIEETSSYDFVIVVEDALGNKSSTFERHVSTRAVLMHFTKGGTGIGIGKVCETASLEVALPAKFTGGVENNGIRLPEIQHGRVTTGKVSAKTMLTGTVTFQNKFSGTPNVCVSIDSSTESAAYGSLSVITYGITDSGFTWKLCNNDDAGREPNFICWMAMY